MSGPSALLNGAMAGFGLETGALLIALARWIAMSGTLSAFGALLFRAAIAPPAGRGLIWGSLAVALLGMALWLGLEASALGGPPGLVLRATLYGRVLAFQAGALLLAGLFALARQRLAGCLAAFWAALAVVLEAGHLHAWSMEPGVSLLLAAEAVHLLAAGAWLGGLLPLRQFVGRHSAGEGARAARRFGHLAALAVAALVATAFWQAFVLSGGMGGLLGTAYGWMELLKLTLFAALLLCAALNRWRFLPRLDARADAGRALRMSIAVETGLGLMIVLAAAVLTGLPPGMHLEPVWPFAVRPSLAIVRADPILREEVANAVLALLGALALVALGIVVRWIRWIAVAVAVLIAWYAVPHFDLLFMPAYPTSFYRSPTQFAARSIVDGAALYPRHCASCHGESGAGDGPAAKGLALSPADLTLPHLFEHSDGELFWRLAQGFPGARGQMAMPGFRSVLSDGQIWDLIDYLRARNGGLARRAGEAVPALAAPDFDVSCAGQTKPLAALRGRVLAIGFGPEIAVTSADGLACTAASADVREAYAIVTGQSEQALAGGTVIVDADGWLREVLGPDRAHEVSAALDAAARAPLPPDAAQGEAHMHHHEP